MTGVGGQSRFTTREVPVYDPPREATEEIQVRRAELRRIWKLVNRLGNPVESASAWAYVWTGVAITAGLSLLVLMGENPVTGKKANVKTWVLYANGSAVVIGVFLACFCWWFARKGRRNQATDKDLVLRELEGIDPECAEPDGSKSA